MPTTTAAVSSHDSRRRRRGWNLWSQVLGAFTVVMALTNSFHSRVLLQNGPYQLQVPPASTTSSTVSAPPGQHDDKTTNNATLDRHVADASILATDATRATSRQNHSLPSIPNLLIVGTQKAGTTSLYAYLSDKPYVCTPTSFEGEPRHFRKEVHFFDKQKRFNAGLQFYQRRFAHCQKQKRNMAGDRGIRYLLDTTPGYVKFATRVHEIYQQAGTQDHGQLKVILTVRNPVHREISIYNHMMGDILTHPEGPPRWAKATLTNRTDGRLLTFAQHARLVTENPQRYGSQNLYARWLREWTRFFDRSQILVLSFDELQRDRPSFLRRLHAFLQLPPHDDGKPARIPHINAKNAHWRGDKTDKSAPMDQSVPCVLQDSLAARLTPHNDAFYQWMQQHPGPVSEQRPFPRFETTCDERLRAFVPREDND